MHCIYFYLYTCKSIEVGRFHFSVEVIRLLVETPRILKHRFFSHVCSSPNYLSERSLIYSVGSVYWNNHCTWAPRACLSFRPSPWKGKGWWLWNRGKGSLSSWGGWESAFLRLMMILLSILLTINVPLSTFPTAVSFSCPQMLISFSEILFEVLITCVFITRWCSCSHFFAPAARILQPGRILRQCYTHWIAFWHSILISQLKVPHTFPSPEWKNLWMLISLYQRQVVFLFLRIGCLNSHVNRLQSALAHHNWSIFCNWSG